MIVKPGAILVRGQFHILDDEGNVVDTKPGPEKVLHHPHVDSLQEYILDCVQKIEKVNA